MTATGRVASEARPNAFSLGPQDKFLFSAGQDSGRMATFSVNQSTWRLDTPGDLSIGNHTEWRIRIINAS